MNNAGLLQFIFLLTLAVVFLFETVVGETYAECEGIPERTFTGSSKKCSGYIFCNGEESFDGECEEGEYFNAVDGVCDGKEFVDCKLEEVTSNSSTTLVTPATITATTRRTSTTNSTPLSSVIITSSTTVPASSTIRTTSVSTATTILSTIKANITNSLPTSNSTESFITTTATTTTSTTTPASTSLTVCPHADNPLEIVFLSNTKSCSAYFVCINGTPVEMFCSRMLHFNVKTGKCDYPENVKCLSSYSQPKEQCRRHIVDYYPHTDNCNYYYLCQSGFLMLEQCPLFYGWDIEKRTCVALSKAKCFNQAAFY